MSHSIATVGVRLRIDIGPDCSIGPGKIALLEQIERSGSLSKAARILDMSYRRAWLLLEDLNRTLGQPVTTASVGGAGGGGAQITPFGRHVIAAFRQIEQAAVDAAVRQLDWLTQSGVSTTAKPVAPRRAVNRSLLRGRGEVAGGDEAVPGTTAPEAPTEAVPPKKRVRATKRP